MKRTTTSTNGVIEVFNRQELKYVISREQYEAFHADPLRYMTYDAHNTHGAIYPLYNLYIDTSDNALIRHSVSKPVEYKEKLRIRSYKPFYNTGDVFLEVKKRYKKVTNKRRTTMKYHEALSFVKKGIIPLESAVRNQQVIDEFSVMLSNEQYEPKTYISYDRLALVAKDKASDLRITFDSNIRAQRYGENSERLLLSEDQIIMELKSGRNVPLWLVELLNMYAIRRQGFSKYGQEYAQYLMRKRQEVAYA